MQIENIEVKANYKWKYVDISCLSCKKNLDDTQCHILNCELLFGRNKNVSYIPDYNELYTGDLKEQICVPRLLKENYKRRVQEL